MSYVNPLHYPVNPTQFSSYSSLIGATPNSQSSSQFISPSRRRLPQQPYTPTSKCAMPQDERIWFILPFPLILRDIRSREFRCAISPGKRRKLPKSMRGIEANAYRRPILTFNLAVHLPLRLNQTHLRDRMPRARVQLKTPLQVL
jgi:hypothetical protein